MATEAETNGDNTPPGEAAEIDEPIEASMVERALAVFVIATMAGAMIYAVWIVIRYWNRVAV